MPRLAYFATLPAVALLIAGCNRSEKLSDVAANTGMEITHGEGAAGGEGYGLSNQSAELPDIASTANTSR